uniref:Uncharacterized protein n=1 Tax=viral metagenome TaxID=1070528 RepID=A0A6C0LRF7_9ZZZZ
MDLITDTEATYDKSINFSSVKKENVTQKGGDDKSMEASNVLIDDETLTIGGAYNKLCNIVKNTNFISEKIINERRRRNDEKY